MIAIDQNTIQILFALLRSAIRGDRITDDEKELFSNELLPELYELSKKHDIAHLVAAAINTNELLNKEDKQLENEVVMAIYRYTQINNEYINLCHALEDAGIAFIPLKGSVIRKYYPKPWMRTSCDIDVLVHREDLDKAISYLVQTLHYTEKGRATHDVSLFTQKNVHIELHFDLVEEERAGNAIDILKNVWKNVSLKEGKNYWYEMSDEFFYFYHIAHMAKHFEVGGCGVRPFIDLWILDKLDGINQSKRNELLKKGGLLKFAEVAGRLSKCWLDNISLDELTAKMQNFILVGGVYGTAKNRVALQQTKKGGRIGYLFSRIFIPYSKLKRYYPILEKHCWLMPIMQVRRWFMIFRPDVAKMAKRELSSNNSLDKEQADEMNAFLLDIGL